MHLIYMYIQDLALNNLQWLICHQTQTHQTTHETLLQILERATAGIGVNVNADKTEYLYYNQTGDISTLDGTSLKLVDKFTYFGSSVSTIEKTHRHTANEGMDSYR